MADKDKILSLFTGHSESEQAEKLDIFFRSMGDGSFRQSSVEWLLKATQAELAVPSSLHRFLLLIQDGLSLLLQKVSYERLKETLLVQIRLPAECEPAERLVYLAREFPTLQKLAQIVARNENLTWEVKKWLVTLEEERNQKDIHGQRERLIRWCKKNIPTEKIDIFPRIHARASVAEVLRFDGRNDATHSRYSGVFKTLKPGMKKYLAEELNILAEVFQHLEQNRGKYGVANLKLNSLFTLVRRDLEQEINLDAEQRNLRVAQEIYKEQSWVHVPRLLDGCSAEVTSMEFIDGDKITDVCLPISQRKKLAKNLFEAVICIPLFSEEENSLFHGDPHAGNILAVQNRKSGDWGIALIDWTLAGHLPRVTRRSLIGLMMAVLQGDHDLISQAIQPLLFADDGSLENLLTDEYVSKLLKRRDFQEAPPLKRTFMLLEELTMDGLVLSRDLVLFRKVFFTLEGVVDDLFSGFDSGLVMAEYLGRLLYEEFPQRFLATITKGVDVRSDYRSMLSSGDLQTLAMVMCSEELGRFVQGNLLLATTPFSFARDFLNYYSFQRPLKY